MLQVVRLARRDGSQALTAGPAGQWQPELLRTALRFVGKKAVRQVAEMTLPSFEAGQHGKAKRPDAKQLPSPAQHSEWAETAILRPDWARRSPRLTIAYAERQVQAELSSGRDVLFSGQWNLNVSVNGVEQHPTGPWEEVCWVSDKDVDYLELEIALENGWRCQRQILLAREDEFLFMADALLGGQPADIQYRSTLPLGSHIRFDTTLESREGFLEGSKRRGLVLPLALPECALRRYAAAWKGQVTAWSCSFPRPARTCLHRCGSI